jgi:hypothetical protein
MRLSRQAAVAEEEGEEEVGAEVEGVAGGQHPWRGRQLHSMGSLKMTLTLIITMTSTVQNLTRIMSLKIRRIIFQLAGIYKLQYVTLT